MIFWISGGKEFHLSLFMTTNIPVEYEAPKSSVVYLTTSPHFQVFSDSWGAMEASTTPRLRAS